MTKAREVFEEHEFAHDVDIDIKSGQPDSISKEAFGGHSVDDLPPNYFKNYRFIGSFISFALAYQSNFLGFVMIANVLSIINIDIGPSPDLIWVLLSYILSETLMFTIIGRLSDIFGRRYYYIGGSTLSLIGAIICSRATSINMLIGGMVPSGIGGGIQASSAVASGEMIPNKHRYLALGAVFVLLSPISSIGPGLARTFIDNTADGWRWCYYLLIMINALTLLLQIVCYFPPTFQQLHQARSKMELIKSLDYVGFVLFSIGLASILLGISWGGQQFAWSSSEVIGTILGGVIGLTVFAAWEHWSGAQSPLMPLYLFKNRNYVSLMICSSVGVMVFYAVSIVWPLQIAAMFQASPKEIGWISCTLTAGAVFGQGLGAVCTNFFGKIKWQLVFCCCVFTAFIGSMAAVSPDTKGMAIALSLIAGIAIGYMEVITVGGGVLMVEAENIGLAVGIQYAVRLAMSSLSSSIYVTVLTNQLTTNLPKYIIPAAIKSGLSEAAAVALLGAIASSNSTAVGLVPGITPSIIQTVTVATQVAYQKSFETVYLVSIAFGALAIIFALVVSSSKLEEVMTPEVARKLQGIAKAGLPDEEKVLDHERLKQGVATVAAGRSTTSKKVTAKNQGYINHVT